jgi:hypothetical protein
MNPEIKVQGTKRGLMPREANEALYSSKTGQPVLGTFGEIPDVHLGMISFYLDRCSSMKLHRKFLKSPLCFL